jgi:hypothetical protein
MPAEGVRGKIAFYSVLIYMGVGAAIMVLTILGYGSIDGAVSLLQAWGNFTSLIVGAAVGYYFGSSNERR